MRSKTHQRLRFWVASVLKSLLPKIKRGLFRSPCNKDHGGHWGPFGAKRVKMFQEGESRPRPELIKYWCPNMGVSQHQGVKTSLSRYWNPDFAIYHLETCVRTQETCPSALETITHFRSLNKLLQPRLPDVHEQRQGPKFSAGPGDLQPRPLPV